MRRKFKFVHLLIILAVIQFCWVMYRVGGNSLPHNKTDVAELVQNMDKAIKNINGVQFTVEFEVDSVTGPITGTMKFWGEQGRKIRIEISSPVATLDGTIIIADGQQATMYQPHENLVTVVKKEQYNSLLSELPGVGDIIYLLLQIFNRGFNNVETLDLGIEQINQRITHKVQIIYRPDKYLENVTTIFWIDQETFLPQQLRLAATKNNFTAGGIITLINTMIKNKPIDPTKFVFMPPPGVKVRNLPE